jgi:hypothetical protein
VYFVILVLEGSENGTLVRASDMLYMRLRRWNHRRALAGKLSSSFQPCTRLRVLSSISALTPFSCGRNRAYSSDQLTPEGC